MTLPCLVLFCTALLGVAAAAVRALARRDQELAQEMDQDIRGLIGGGE